MATTHIITLLVTGVAVGFAGSMLGLGGGFIMVPIQYLVFANMGIPMAMKMALGNSLLVIFPTAISGALRHHIKGAVFWKAAVIIGCCALVCSFVGATIATRLPDELLKLTFGAIILIGGIRMVTFKLPEIEEEPKNNPWLWVAWALPIGMVSGLTGLGGGIIAVPVMTLALRFKMHNAIATSQATMILTSAGGVIGGFDVRGMAAMIIFLYACPSPIDSVCSRTFFNNATALFSLVPCDIR